MKAAGVMGAHPSATYLLMRRQIARFYSLLARVDWEYRRETITGDGLRLTQPRMKEAETMAYRILLVEYDSHSGTEQVPPPRGGHLRHDIKCGGVTPTRTQAAVWADNISPAPNKEWEAEFNWQLAAQASVAGFMGTPPCVSVET